MESLYRWSAQKWLLKIAYNEQSLLRFGVFCCQCCLELTDDVDFCLPWTEKLLVCLLDQRRVLSEVSSWDDSDIGSGVHSKVNLFAVDQDFCMPLVLEFQRVDWGCSPRFRSLSGINCCDDTQYDILFFFQSSESFLWMAHSCVVSLHKTLSAFRLFGWTVLSSMHRAFTAACTFLASSVSRTLKSLRVVHFPWVLFPLFCWYSIDLCTYGIGLGHRLRLLSWSFVGSA